MTSASEQRLLAFVADVRELARAGNAEVADALERACADLSAAFASADLEARYEAVLRLYVEYASPVQRVIYRSQVMGGLPELWYPTLELLQAYWRAMGREHYDTDSFPRLPYGSCVRMQRKALQSRDLLKGTLDYVGWPNSKGVWVVDDLCGVDVDGVPLYWVEREDGKEGTIVRQTALLPPGGPVRPDPGQA